MALNKITDSQIATYGVQSAPDVLSGSAAENKKVFDRLIANVVAVYFNALVDALVAPTGAGEVGASVAGINENTVLGVLAALKALRDSDSSAQGATNTSLQAEIENRYTKAQTDAMVGAKADTTTVNTLVKSIAFNSDNGVFTITTQGGAVTTIDTLLEKVPASFALENNQLVLTLEDGTKQTADLSAFIDTYTFTSGGTVVFNQTGKNITAEVKDGSLALSKLTSEAQNTIAGYATKAEAAKEAAEAAKTAAEAAKTTAQGAATTATTKANEASASATSANSSKNAAATSESNARTSANSAADSASAAASAKTAAESAKTMAGNSETNAKKSETGAANSAAAALASEQAAGQYKNAAEAASGSAQMAANTASTKANEASESATSALNAQNAAETAKMATEAIATESESYAKGGTGTRTNEDTDNAKYYAQQAKEYKEQAGEIVGGDFATRAEVTAAKQEAINAAATDATSKANTAESNAKTAAQGYANTAETNAKNASDPKGSASAVQTNLNNHAGNTTQHITAGERTKWNGKAEVVKTGQITLTAAGWAGEGTFTQAVSHPNIGANTQVNVDASIALLNQMEADGVLAVFIENDGGAATAYAKGAAFTADVTIDVTFVEVSV
jgi:hypothetical protein